MRTSSRASRIFSSANVEIPSQIDAFFSTYADDNLTPSGEFDISFVADVPPLGAATYYVAVASSGTLSASTNNLATHAHTRVYLASAARAARATAAYASKHVTYHAHDAQAEFIENAFLKVFVEPKTGMVKSVTQLRSSSSSSANGDNLASFGFEHKLARYITTRSGAYLFRPTTPRAEYWHSQNDSPTVRITRGPIRSTVATMFHGHTVITRLYGSPYDRDADIGEHLSIQSFVSAESNTELVSVFAAPNFPATNRKFQTHSGIDFVDRASRDGNAAANFYPGVLGARMRGGVPTDRGSRSFTILTAHSMAIGSNVDGELECMMHRSLAQDDGRGLSEPVNDMSRVEVPIWVSFGKRGTERRHAAECVK